MMMRRLSWILFASLLTACGGKASGGGGSSGSGGTSGGNGGSTGGSAGNPSTAGSGGAACTALYDPCTTSKACCSGYCRNKKCDNCPWIGQKCPPPQEQLCCSQICNPNGTCGCVPKGALALDGPYEAPQTICCSGKMDANYVCL